VAAAAAPARRDVVDGSSRSYADWKGSWAPVTVPLGAIIAVIGLVLALGGR
jgi:hypothetical protein